MDDLEPFTDPYLDPRTGILRNLVAAATRGELDVAEADLTWARTNQLLDAPPQNTGDLAQLRAIHRHLFQDLYEWAGELRTVDLAKDTPGARPFLPVPFIEGAAGFAASELRDDDMLRDLDRESFVKRLAYHYDAFNYIHPFREGNGRAQRLMWSRIASDAGWMLDWQGVRGDMNDDACRVASEQGDLGPLEAMFDSITSEAPREAPSP